jgi:hypothetical protein
VTVHSHAAPSSDGCTTRTVSLTSNPFELRALASGSHERLSHQVSIGEPVLERRRSDVVLEDVTSSVASTVTAPSSASARSIARPVCAGQMYPVGTSAFGSVANVVTRSGSAGAVTGALGCAAAGVLEDAAASGTIDGAGAGVLPGQTHEASRGRDPALELSSRERGSHARAREHVPETARSRTLVPYTNAGEKRT